ncbi:hypothetical protein [Streptomyces sp. NBC_00385]|uniref:hypothetical protein n=1 Tax=Streptomyces sp. NBC_00385 TaxID=2975733 RepID=UPI002DDBFD81|nr:hypothetical protein [Streptomyces sp. NBC_00385]WRZ05953.1 hypothetical protein OG959_22715 [Streptomyces sp. NBC_00385]
MSSYGSPSPLSAPPSAPPPGGVPPFPPLRVRGGSGHRLRRAVWRQRRAMAAGLALTAAALAASGLGGGEAGSGDGGGPGGGRGAAEAAGTASRRVPPPVRLVSAPVRIADAETVRLLRPGDRVDVIASEGAGAGSRVLAKGARVTRVPAASTEGSTENGALIVLSVPRATATTLAGAGISAGFAVILC